MKKKLFHIISLWLLIWLWFFCTCNAQRYWWVELSSDMPYTTGYIHDYHKTELWERVSVKEDNNTIIVRLLEVFWLDNSTDRTRDLKFIDYARAIINMALWLVAFIALIMSLYTFYLMFFSDNEAGIKKAKWNLVGIFIALAILWLAWIIVSFIFRWYQSNWKENENDLFPESGNVSVNYTKTINNQIYLTI